MRERTIKVSEEEYQKLMEARRILAQRGYSNLPVQPTQNQPDDFSRGAIVGLGLAALIYLLTKEDD